MAHTILLVDDQIELLTLTADLLEEFGYDVVTAMSAEQALQKNGQDGAFDRLITDIPTPGELRDAVCRALAFLSSTDL